MADKKEIPLALLEVLKRHTDEDHYLSTKQIIQIMEDEYDITMERRTLYANIELLQKFGNKISTWQENGYGYYLQEHQFLKSEVFLLCNAIHSSHFISGKESSQLIDKLLETLSTDQKKQYTDKVYLPNKKKTRNGKLMETISLISDAIRDRHPISFTYLRYNQSKELEARRPEPYVIEPRYIVYHDSRPYLIATSDHHYGFANYRIDRIGDLRIIENEKTPALKKDQDAYEYAKNMYYMFNDDQVSAAIRCESRVLDHVIDIFGSDCIILPSNSGYFEVHIKGSETGILLFAQQYLDAVDIIEPDYLREEMKSRLKVAINQYRK